MRNPDLLDAIRTALSQNSPVLAHIEPVLEQMRQTYGGDTVYIRAPAHCKITRRAMQQRARRAIPRHKEK